jgi:hypothetical protein
MSAHTAPAQVEVSFEFSRHMGPRFVHGGVTLSFDADKPYAFVSEATWPTPDNYESTIREAVEVVLIERQGGLERTRVLLKRIMWHEIDSCESGFRQAARAATLAAFEV